MVLLMMVNAVFDVLGLATIFILIHSALQDNVLTDPSYLRLDASSEFEYIFNTQLRNLYAFFGSSSPIAFMFYLSIAIFVIFLLKNAISLVIVYIQTRFAYNVSLRLNKKMFKYFYDQGYLFIKDSSSGKKVYSIVDIPMRFAGNYLNQVLLLSTELMVLIIIGAALIMYEPLAVLVMMVIIAPVFILIYQITKNRVKTIGYERNVLAPKNYARVFESMKAYVDVKLSNIENKIMEDYSRSQSRLNRLDAINLGLYQKIHQKTNDIIFGLGILVIFGYAYFAGIVKEDVLTLLGVFVVAAYRFLPSVNRMMNSILAIKNSSYVIDELRQVSHQKLTKFDDVKALAFESSIVFDKVKYRYTPSTPLILNEFSLEIQKGQTIGVIGSSGSGKTTLLKLLLRLIKEEAGQILIDGNALSTKDDASFQRIMGYVEQDVFILNASLAANVAFGEEVPDENKLRQSIIDARLWDFVSEQAEGVQMKLGENGVNLSGGQKQRIGIARALYKHSEILVFDEATSALDSETERAVVESINHLSELGKTIIIVAHRITTLEKCDRIIELKGGKKVREYSYDELISIKPKNKRS